ncbi:MAG: hypothetical protein ACJ76F_06090 [Bacteroidia bacterium]
MNRFFYSLLFLVGSTAFAQEVKEDLVNAAMTRFSGNVYVYGYKSEGKDLYFKVSRFSEELQRIKDTSILLGAAEPKDFHPIGLDTMHAFLSFNFQRVDNDKFLKVIRLNKNLKKIAVIPEAEVTRVNTFAAFDDEKLFVNNDLYIIRTSSKDSSYKLYLHKFHLTDPTKIYEYKMEWQFNFERNRYKRCHVIMVNERYVYVYANVLSGPKTGQWILLIDVENGEMIHAEMLNEGMNDFYFLYSGYYYNAATGDLVICGAKVPKAGNELETGKFDLAVSKLKTVNTFICRLDSNGFVKERKDNFIPVPPELAKDKELKNYLFRTRKILYYNNEYSLLTEIVAEANPKLYKTYGFIFTHLSHDEAGVLKLSATSCNLTYRDPKILSAKQISDNYELVKSKDTDWLFYKPALARSYLDWPWDIQFSGKTVKGLSELEVRKANKLTIYQYLMNNTKWENKELISGTASSGLKVIPLSTKKYLRFSTDEPDAVTKLSRSFSLVLKDW